MSDDSKKNAGISVSRNGPYVVSNIEDIAYSGGERIESEPVMALCRCGGSKSKPYCDGTHKEIGFEGEKRYGEAWRHFKSWKGSGITIHFNQRVCIHAAVCLDSLPEVFDVFRSDWIDPNGADAKRIAEVIDRCPSGALSYDLEGDAQDDLENHPRIVVERNGPYNVDGGVEIWGESGASPYNPDRYSLCRCGKSKNKPFCDAAHIFLNRFDAEPEK
jgi:CDGSH-type Zn-finger protein